MRPNGAHLIRWREFGKSAFADAARDRKPIALLLTAFWCGICQRLDETALSSNDVQLLLNAYFVPIRVEESQRPDVDLRYTRDGWPTLVFLTPHAEPILTVNAMETEPLIDVLVQIVDRNERTPDALTAAVESPSTDATGDPASLSAETLEYAFTLVRDLADPVDAGFGGPHKYFFIDALRWWLHREQYEHVAFTLRTLTERRIYDQAGGGFFRYSSQPDWNEPHPEKLLADQADLLRVYLEAFEATGEPSFAATATKLIDYLDATLGRVCAPFFAGCEDLVALSPDSPLTSVIDDYVYCDANARAASAYLVAARVLDRAECGARAEEILDGLWAKLRTPDGGVCHYFDGAAHAPRLLVDSVELGLALLDGYAMLDHTRYLQAANQLASDVLRLHLNPSGGFFDIAEPGPAALQRRVTVLSQCATAARFFLRSAELSGDARMRDAAQWALLGYRGSLDVYGAYAASFGYALDLYLEGTV